MRRALKWTGIGLLGLVVLVAAALVAGRYWLASDGGRAFLADQAESAGVRLTGLAGDPFGRLTAARVEIADSDGVWLAVEDAEIDWRPTALFGREILVERIVARRVAVERAPIGDASAEPSAESEPLSPPPIAVTVRELRVAEIALAEALAGQAITLEADGALTYASGAADVRLTVERTNGPGRLALAGTYRLDANAFSLDLTASDPPGGLATGMLGLSNGVEARLEGEGDLSRWQGRLNAISGETTLADLALEVGRSDGAIRLAVDGDLQPQPLLPPDVHALIGDVARIGLTAVAAEDGSAVAVERLQVATAAAEIDGTGRFEPETGAISANLRSVRLDPAAVGQFAPELRLSAPRATVEIAGTIDAPEAHVSLDLESVETGDIALGGLSLQADALPSAAGPVDWNARLVATRLALGQPAIDPILEGGWTIDARGAFDPAADAMPVSAVVVGGKGISARFEGSASQAGAVVGQANASVSDLEPFQPLVGMPITGPGEIAAQVDFGDAGLTLTDISIQAIGASLAGRLQLDGTFDRIDGAFDVAVSDLRTVARLVDAPVAGTLQGKVEVSGALSNPASKGDLAFTPLVAAGETVRRARIQYVASDLATGPKGNVEIGATTAYGAIDARSAFALQGDKLALSKLRVAAPGATVAGDLAVNLATTVATGRLAVDASDLAKATAAVGADVSGSATGALRLAGDKRGRQTVDADMRFANLAAGGVVVEAGRLTAKGGVDGASRLDVDLRASGVKADGADAKSVRLTLNGPLKGADVRLTVDGAAAGEPLKADIRGRLAVDDKGQRFDLTRGQGAFAGAPFTLAPGLRVNNGSSGLSVAGLDFASKPLDLKASFSLNGDRIDLQLRQADADLDAIAELAPALPVSGDLSAQGRIGGTISTPTGRIDLKATRLRMNDDPNAPTLGLAGSVTLRPGLLALDFQGQGLGEQPLTLAGTIGLVGAGGGPPAPGPNSPLDLRIAWNGDVGPLMALAPVDGHRLSGAGAIDLTVRGVVDRPDARGTVTLGPGVYENLEYGTKLEFQLIEILANGPRIELKPFTAKAGGGEISVEASADLDGARGYPFQVTAALADALLAARDDIVATASGNVRLESGKGGMSVYARIDTEKIEVELIDNLPASIPELRVVELGPLPPGRKDEIKEESGPGLPVALDVEVVIPDRLYVRGRGLDSEWNGQIGVTGTAAAPVVNGQINLKRGTFDLLGKQLELTEGVVRLQPNASGELEAVIDILAVYEGSDFSASVRLDGLADQPQMTLTSTPDLPRDEILARLLFGKNAGALTAIESVQLAAAVATLTGGGGGGFDPIRSIRQATGIDALRVDTSGDAGPTVEAGKYVTDDVYIGVKQGATAGQGSVVVEVELFDNVTVESESKQDGSQKVGARLKWDY